MTEVELTSISVAELALRLVALSGTAAYATYVIAPRDAMEVMKDLKEELSFIDESLAVATLETDPIDELFGPHASQVILINATALTEADWMLLDRRRSSLKHAGVTLFLTSSESLTELMRGVANLTSWLAFAYKHTNRSLFSTDFVEQRLSALRVWASKTDQEVVRDAIARILPPDPEYAEWLVLLGRGDLLSPSGT